LRNFKRSLSQLLRPVTKVHSKVRVFGVDPLSTWLKTCRIGFSIEAQKFT
jgi:hypothetical protein